MNTLLAGRWPADKNCVFVSREEADRWHEDDALRAEIQMLFAAEAERMNLVPVCTLGGFIVDVWIDGGWQSGLPGFR